MLQSGVPLYCAGYSVSKRAALLGASELTKTNVMCVCCMSGVIRIAQTTNDNNGSDVLLMYSQTSL